MIVRILLSVLLLSLCYVLYKFDVGVKIPGISKIRHLYTSFQDVCGHEALLQLGASERRLKMVLELQSDMITSQIKRHQITLGGLEKSFELILSKVVAVPLDEFPQKVYISIGAKDGMRKYSLVLKDGFLFGRVVNVDVDTSEVLSVFSPMFYVDVVFMGTGHRAILQGDPTGKMKIFATYGGVDLEKIPHNTVLVTAGSRNNSPFGIPVAYVSEDKSIVAFADHGDLVYLTGVVESRSGGE